MKFSFTPSPLVCSQMIDIEINGGIIDSIKFYGGCQGNLTGISRLVKGKTPEEVIALLKGISCGGKSTSCPDQLAVALSEYLAKKQ